VFVPLLGVDRWVEVKARRHGFAELYRWLVKHDLLILKRDCRGSCRNERARPLHI
jgi:hypothetical protein